MPPIDLVFMQKETTHRQLINEDSLTTETWVCTSGLPISITRIDYDDNTIKLHLDGKAIAASKAASNAARNAASKAASNAASNAERNAEYFKFRNFGGGGAPKSPMWVSTGRKVTIQKQGSPAAQKTVFRNSETKELCVRKATLAKNGTRRFAYVKF